MTARAPVLLAALLLEDEHLLRLVLLQDAPDHPGALQDRAADLKPAVRLQRKDLVERHLVPDAGHDLLDPNTIADGDLVLLAPGTDHGIAHALTSFSWTSRRLYWPPRGGVNAGSARNVSSRRGKPRRGAAHARSRRPSRGHPMRMARLEIAAPRRASPLRSDPPRPVRRIMRKIGSRNWRALLVFVVAYAVRLVYILEIRKAPYFDVPLIDGPNYFRMAAAIASGSLTGGREVFWQPPLYPYFLALLSVTVGDRMQTIYAVQAALGSLSCVLVYWIGRRLFGARPALIGALVAALYGPLIYFDAQPLIPFLHIVLALGGILMLLRGAGVGEAAGAGPPAPAAVRRRRFLGAGVLWGLSATATPNILVAVPAAAWWTWRRMRPAAAARMFLLGVAVPVLAVTARNAVVA